jgi:hypothetical protein
MLTFGRAVGGLPLICGVTTHDAEQASQLGRRRHDHQNLVTTCTTCASLLAALDVHPRVAMAILRHSRIALTMEIYTQVPDKVTRDALRRLSDQLDSDQADEDEPGAAGPGQPGIE